MSATTQLTDFSDLYSDLMNRIRADTTVSATKTQAQRYINIALHDLHLGFGEKLSWAERSDVLRTHDNYTTGTVAISKGSTALTGTSTLWNTNDDFGDTNARTTGKMTIDGGSQVYGISAVGSDTSITLNDPFLKTTVTAASYEYFEDEYDLATDFLRPTDLQMFDTNQEIPLIGRQEFRRRWPRNKTPGKPKVATIVDRSFGSNTTPVRRVVLHPPPNDYFMIPYNYVTSNLAVTSAGVEQTQLSGDTDEPIVPLIYRHAIVFHALYHWYRDKKNDDRSAEAKSEYVDIMLRITGDQEIGASRPQFMPRLGPYVRAARRPYSAGSRGRYTTGSSFDELRS